MFHKSDAFVLNRFYCNFKQKYKRKMLETYHKPQQPEIKRKTACQLANSRDYQDVFNVPEKEEAA